MLHIIIVNRYYFVIAPPRIVGSGHLCYDSNLFLYVFRVKHAVVTEKWAIHPSSNLVRYIHDISEGSMQVFGSMDEL